MPEIIDIFNETGRKVGSVDRDQAEHDNQITQNVLIFIFNSDGRVWVQLRPKTKSHYPGLWDISACGGVLSGEAPAKAALRETQEETGIQPYLHHVESFLNVMSGELGEERRRLSHLYVAVSDDQPKTNEEVDEFRIWHPRTLIKEINSHPNFFVPSFLVELNKAIVGYKKLK